MELGRVFIESFEGIAYFLLVRKLGVEIISSCKKTESIHSYQ